MSVFVDILAVIGFMLKTVLDSAINTSSKLLFGIVLLIQTIAGAFGAGQTLSLVISFILVGAIMVLLFKWLWGTARNLVVVVIGVVLIAIILSYVSPSSISAAPIP